MESMKFKSKLAQEEIVGFAVIMILVAVILVIFLGIYLNKEKSNVMKDDYILTNFVNILGEYTTDCETNNKEFNLLGDVVSLCSNNRECLDGRKGCDVLEEVVKEIMDVTWPVGEDWPNKKYELRIVKNSKELLFLEKGVNTQSYKSYGGIGVGAEIELKIYS